MAVGSVARVVSVVLLLVLGGSGALVGLSLFGAMATVGVGPGGAGVWIAAAVLAYGLVLVAAAVGVTAGRRWAWPVGSVALAIGIGVLMALWGVTDRDEVLGGGMIVWAVALACLGVARGLGAA